MQSARSAFVSAVVAALLAVTFEGAAARDAWRDVPVTVASSSGGAIDVAGQAATGGGAAAACVTFTDLDARTLKRVVVRIDFEDAEGRVLATRTMDRGGTFGPHAVQLGSTGSGGNMRLLNGARQCAFIDGRAMTFRSAALHVVRLVPVLLRFVGGTTVEPAPEPSPAP